MRMFDLFSGIGGFSLAASWAGIETVAFCEQDAYCQKVLRKHWPDVPIVDDIFKMGYPKGWTDIGPQSRKTSRTRPKASPTARKG